MVKWRHECRHHRPAQDHLDHVRPAVLRRAEVPFDIRLDRLHLIIHAAKGWTNTQLYEIRAGGVGWSTPDPDADWVDDFLDARKARLGEVLEDIGTKTLACPYDFGDGWLPLDQRQESVFNAGDTLHASSDGESVMARLSVLAPGRSKGRPLEK